MTLRIERADKGRAQGGTKGATGGRRGHTTGRNGLQNEGTRGA